MSEARYIGPKVSGSYAWEDEEHMRWVGDFAARLRGDGVEVSLDQWIARLGEQLPELMENLVRENDRVLVICMRAYEERSDRRIGGVGYEGGLMTGEVLTQRKRGSSYPYCAKTTGQRASRLGCRGLEAWTLVGRSTQTPSTGRL